MIVTLSAHTFTEIFYFLGPNVVPLTSHSRKCRENVEYSKPFSRTSRHAARGRVTLPAETFGNRKCSMNFSLTKPRQKTKANFMTYELLICGDIYHINN